MAENLNTVSRREFLGYAAGALAAPMAFGCGWPTDVGSGDPRLTARPGTPTVAATLGLTRLNLDVGRNANLYVPQSYSPDVPLPLFIALHGAGGSADDWESYYNRADQRGMIFLSIKSWDFSWDLIADASFGKDVKAIDEALMKTFERCAVDASKISFGGFSDGASYALSLGVSNGDLFTHLVGYSPGFIASAPPTVGKPKIYISHGTQDAILPVNVSRLSTVPILREAGYDVTYEEFDGAHIVPAAISESALDWFLAVPQG